MNKGLFQTNSSDTNVTLIRLSEYEVLCISIFVFCLNAKFTVHFKLGGCVLLLVMYTL